MSIVLRNQVEASEKSAEEIEAQFQREHRAAMLCCDVQDLAHSLVNLFGELNKDVERWQGESRRVQLNLSEPERDAAQWEALYHRLESIFQRAANLVRSMESSGHAVEGKDEFLIAWRELRGITCFSFEHVKQSIEQVRQGRTRTLGDIRDALSGPAH